MKNDGGAKIDVRGKQNAAIVGDGSTVRSDNRVKFVFNLPSFILGAGATVVVDIIFRLAT